MLIEFVLSRPRCPAPDPGGWQRRPRDYSGDFSIFVIAVVLVAGFAGFATAGNFPPVPELRPDAPAEKADPPDPVDLEQPPLPFEPDVTIAMCNAALGNQTAEFIPIEPVREAIVCGHSHPILLNGLTLDGVDIEPSAKTNCGMAGALTRWLLQSVQSASMQHFGEPVTALRNAASYVCRTRNNVPGARVSEHATMNALDISAFQLASGRWIDVAEFWTSDGPESLFLHDVHDKACTDFTTVIGPDANASHQDHFHLDLGRHGNAGTYRVCE